MLNDASKKGIIEILQLLEDSSVLSLATTVTQGLLKHRITNRDDAISAIFNYSPDALSVLRRKIITREVLLTYLHQNQIPLKLPATKSEIIQKLASYWEIKYTQEVTSNSVDSGTIDTLANQFTQWFYGLLNKSEMSPDHFFPDAKLKINMLENGQYLSEIIDCNSQLLVEKLLSLKNNLNLFFNPNLSGGVQGRVDPHGLVLVLVCGTLHNFNNCVGIFEQIFGLVRDPESENNWKVKMTELHLKSESGISAPPTIQNCDFF